MMEHGTKGPEKDMQSSAETESKGREATTESCLEATTHITGSERALHVGSAQYMSVLLFLVFVL